VLALSQNIRATPVSQLANGWIRHTDDGPPGVLSVSINSRPRPNRDALRQQPDKAIDLTRMPFSRRRRTPLEWTADAIRRERQRIHRHAWIILSLVAIGVCAYYEYPRFVLVTSMSQQRYEVTVVRRDNQYSLSPERGAVHSAELYIAYYAPSPDTVGILRAGKDLAALADHLTQSTQDSLLVIDQITPMVSRWLPFAVHRTIGFKRVENRWQLTNLPWPPSGVCAGNK
jgi:hypothetical protein